MPRTFLRHGVPSRTPAVAPKASKPERPDVILSTTPHVPNPETPRRRVLVKFPTRARPQQFFVCFERWISYISNVHDVTFLVTVDEDDKDTLALSDWIKQRGGIVDIGNSKSKIEAVNVGIAEHSFDIVIVASDDMWPQIQGYDAAIVEDMEREFPDFDGALHYHDGYRGDICTLPVMGRRLYDRFGYVYHPAYSSLWCDNEYTEVVKALGKHWYSPLVLVKHEHPVNTGAKSDSLLKHNNRFFRSDHLIYLARRERNFDMADIELPTIEVVDLPPEERDPILSLLIPTVPVRKGMLDALLAELNRQIAEADAVKDVEIRVLSDNGVMNVGRKRNSLLESATGDYTVFIDDDDKVAPNYISVLLKAIKENPGVDCITFDGEITTNGRDAKIFRFDLELDDRTVSWGYERRPNHLCPIRAEISKAVRFPSLSFGEDTNWSKRLRPLLKTQVRINETLYFYRYSTTGTLTGEGGQNKVKMVEQPAPVRPTVSSPPPKIVQRRTIKIRGRKWPR